MITVEKVHGFNRNSIPDESVTILEIISAEESVLRNWITNVHIWYRPPEECPYGRGNWLVDLRAIDDSLRSVKLPKEMKEDQVMRYCAPLLKILEKNREN